MVFPGGGWGGGLLMPLCVLPALLCISCTVYMGREFIKSLATALLTFDSSRKLFCNLARFCDVADMSSRVMRLLCPLPEKPEPAVACMLFLMKKSVGFP